MLPLHHLLLATLLLTSASLVQAQFPPQCAKQYVRKEWRTLDENAKRAYIGAVLELQKPTDEGPSKYDSYAKMHLELDPQIHGGTSMFLPWHRMFIYKFEQDLRAAAQNDDITVPYWNWQYDSQTPELAPIWGDNDISFGGNGDPNQDNCVTTGPFANWRPANPTPHCLKRQWSGGETIEALPNTDSINAMVSQSLNFATFTTEIESTGHAPTHINIGGSVGDMTTMASPNDPIFWLHHCNVDKLWWNWQLLYPQANQFEGWVHDNGARAQATQEAPLPGYTEDGATVSHVISTQSLCYTYEEMNTATAGLPQLPGADFAGAPPVPQIPMPPPGFQETPEGGNGGDGGGGGDAEQGSFEEQLVRRGLFATPGLQLHAAGLLAKAPPQPPAPAAKAPVPAPKAPAPLIPGLAPVLGLPLVPGAATMPKAPAPVIPGLAPVLGLPLVPGAPPVPKAPAPVVGQAPGPKAPVVGPAPVPKAPAPVIGQAPVPKGPATLPTPAPKAPTGQPAPVGAIPPALQKRVEVKPAPANAAQVDARDRKNLLALRVVKKINDNWIKLNRLNPKKVRSIEAKYKAQVIALNKIDGYVSPCALYNRPDMLVKIAVKKRGKQEFTAVVKNKMYRIKPAATTASTDPKQLSANTLSVLKQACGKKELQKPISEVAPKLVPLCGKPICKKTSVANPFRCRHAWGHGYGRTDRI